MKYFNFLFIRVRIYYYSFLLFIRKFLNGNKNDIIIHLYTLCWNEEKMLPFFLDYYKDYVDQITIIDNYSTDNSESIMKSYKNINVLKYDSDNKVNETLYLKIKNNSWKKSRGEADFVIVCDIDEFLYSNDLQNTIRFLKGNKYTIVKPHGFQMVSEFFPEYSKDRKITDIIRTGFSENIWLSKSILFDPNRIIEINYLPGAHECKPIGEVKMFKSDGLKMLHYKDLSLEYLLHRKRELGLRLSQINLENKWATYYLENEQKTTELFRERLQKSSKVI